MRRRGQGAGEVEGASMLSGCAAPHTWAQISALLLTASQCVYKVDIIPRLWEDYQTQALCKTHTGVQ